MGMRLVVPEVRLKPEIIAVDGVNTTFFFEDLIGDIKFDFFGTSAAAAHAAGVAALMLEADPLATPEQIKTDLESTTLDMGVPGFDYDSGYGLIQADLALAAMSVADPTDSDADGVPDSVDNCTFVPNGPLIPDSGGHGVPQWDTDGDGFGNMCDADLDNSGFVNFGDLAAFKAVFGTPDPHADFNGSGFVNFGDLARFKALFGQSPGPSGVSP
jgi:subtilisin family serine protease